MPMQLHFHPPLLLSPSPILLAPSPFPASSLIIMCTLINWLIIIPTTSTENSTARERSSFPSRDRGEENERSLFSIERPSISFSLYLHVYVRAFSSTIPLSAIITSHRWSRHNAILIYLRLRLGIKRRRYRVSCETRGIRYRNLTRVRGTPQFSNAHLISTLFQAELYGVHSSK